MQQPLISIITVVYNGEKTLEETIKSVAAQSYQNYEYIIVDGNSTDNTLQIIKKYNKIVSSWVSEKDKGIYDAMNKGTLLASGRWIYFLGADDLLRPDAFQKIAPYLQSSGQIVYGNVRYVNENRIYDGRFGPFKFALRNISHQAIFYPSAVFRQNSFDLRFKYLADYVLNLQIYRSGIYTFKHVNLVIADYNDAGSSALNIDSEFVRVRLSLIKETFPFYVYAYVRARSAIKKFIRNG